MFSTFTLSWDGDGRPALHSGSAKHEAVWVVLPFPRQEVIMLRGQDLAEMVTMQTNPYRPAHPCERRDPTVGMVTHFYNEEFLLPYFIRHHAGIFDEVVLIDSGSTDRSRQIIAYQAPSTWRVVGSKSPDIFDAPAIDAEVVEQEKTLSTSWRVALTITEFVVHPDLRGELRSLEATRPTTFHAMRFDMFLMAGDDTHALKRFPNLIEQRTQFTGESWVNGYFRFLHRLPRDHNHYGLGRHTLDVDGAIVASNGSFGGKGAGGRGRPLILLKGRDRSRFLCAMYVGLRGLVYG